MSHSRLPSPTVLPRVVPRRTALSAGALALAAVSGIGAVLTGTVSSAAVAQERADPADAAPGRLIVTFSTQTSPEALAMAAAASGGTLFRTLAPIRAAVLEVPVGSERSARQELLNLPGVAAVERDRLRPAADVTPNDPYFPSGSGSYYGGQWGAILDHAPSAWANTLGAASVVVAVVDTGVSTTHPDLSGRLVAGRNVLNGTTDVTDTDGHGTAVAGVATATTDNATGVAGYCGRCSLMPVKVTNGGSAYDSDLASGVTWAADHGARVVNLSFAGSGISTVLGNAVTYAQSKNVIVVAAAGNSGCDCPTYPASYAGVIGVAGTDQKDALYSYSNRGSWVDVAAPGQNLTTVLKDPLTGAPNGYAPVGGTSLATPAIAGTLALLASAVPTASSAALVDAVLTTTAPLTSGAVATGRVDVGAAMAKMLAATTAATSSPNPTTTETSSPSPTTSTTTVVFSGSLNKGNPSRTFTVPAGLGTATGQLAFAKCTGLALGLSDATGVTTNAFGPSVLEVTSTVAAGTTIWTVSGTCRTSFTLTLTITTP